MAEVNVYKFDGTKTGTMELPDILFGVAANPALVHEAVVAQDANSRVRIAETKDRSEVRGGGRKPWRQKGTGRARHGSRRSPIWAGGGVTFGPIKERVFGIKINKKAKRKALAVMLSDKVASDLFVAVESYDMPEAKTKSIIGMRMNLPGKEKKALVVTTEGDKNLVRAARNIDNTRTISATSLNVKDLVKYPFVIASKAAIEMIVKTYSETSNNRSPQPTSVGDHDRTGLGSVGS
ncbi:MAG: 50S ribosomal protein L4 [bacterium]